MVKKTILILWLFVFSASTYSQDAYKRIDTGSMKYRDSETLSHIDTVKMLPFPICDISNMRSAWVGKSIYSSLFYTDIPPLYKGEYRTSGIIGSFEKGFIYGSGGQENLIGLGTINFAEIGTLYHPNDKWTVNIGVYALKWNFVRNPGKGFGSYGKISYCLFPHIGLHTFGGYFFIPQKESYNYNYGGFVSFDVTDRMKLDFGMGMHFLYPSRQRWIMPIIRQSYRWKGIEVETDFGGVFKGLFNN